MEQVSVAQHAPVRESEVAPLNLGNCLSIALPKGRLLQPSLDALAEAGLQVPSMDEIDRRLIYTTGDGSMRFILARPADVPAYVEHGAADLGITGKDALLEGDWGRLRTRRLRFWEMPLGCCSASGGAIAPDGCGSEGGRLQAAFAA